MPRTTVTNRLPSSLSGLYFQNNTNVVNVTRATPILNLTAVTVEAWVRFDYNKTTNTWSILQYLSSFAGFNLVLNYPNFNFNVGNGTATANKNSNSIIANQGWLHVAGVWNGSTVQVFVNGVSGGTAALSGGNTGTGAATIVIGNSSGGNRAWIGAMSEIRISNNARYTANFTPPTAPFTSDANTVALYHLTEGTGTTANDASGNSMTGTLANAPVWTPGYFQGGVSGRTGTTPIEPITPNSLSNLGLWLKADANVYTDTGTTLATDGQTVQQWNDQSGNSNTASQATAGSRPTYKTNILNGLPVLRFNGTSSNLICTDAASLDPLSYTLMAVVIPSSSTTAQGLIAKDVSTGVTNPPYGIEVLTSNKLQIDGNNTANTFNVAQGGAFVLRTPYIITGNYDTTPAIALYLNGTLLKNTSLAGSTLSRSTGNLNIGQQKAGLARWFNGDIAEIILYNTAITSAQRQGVEAYLSKKWGITTASNRGTTTARTVVT